MLNVLNRCDVHRTKTLKIALFRLFSLPEDATGFVLLFLFCQPNDFEIHKVLTLLMLKLPMSFCVQMSHCHLMFRSSYTT